MAKQEMSGKAVLAALTGKVSPLLLDIARNMEGNRLANDAFEASAEGKALRAVEKELSRKLNIQGIQTRIIQKAIKVGEAIEEGEIVSPVQKVA